MSANPKILFLNITGNTNKGDMSVVIGHIKCIKNFIPEAEITLLSGNVDIDRYYEKFGVEVRKHPWYRRKQSQFVTILIASCLITYAFVKKAFWLVVEKLNKNWKDPLSKYDLVLDTLADRLNEPFHGFSECVYVLLITFLAEVLIGRPIIIGPASIGPLTSRLTRWLAYHILNRVSVILLREAGSKAYLASIGVQRPQVKLAADMAFLLDPAPPEVAEAILEEHGLKRGDKPLVGIIPRWFTWKSVKEEDYYYLMAELIDFLVERLDAQVCLIPHAGAVLYATGIPKDSDVCEKIRGLVRNQHRLFVIRDTLDPMEVKGVISKCNLVISWKLHAAIAATSCGVPTITLYYADKMKWILDDMMGMKEYGIDIRKLNPEQLLSELKSKIDNLWNQRATVTKELTTRTKIAKKLAMSHGEVLKTIAKKSLSVAAFSS